MEQEFPVRLSFRSAVSASAAIAAVIGIVVGVQLASTSDGSGPARIIDRGGQPLPTSGEDGGDGMPMDGGFPVTVIASTVTVNGTPTVKTVTVSKSTAPTTQAEVVGATVTTTAAPVTTTTAGTTTTTTSPTTTTTTATTPTPTGR